MGNSRAFTLVELLVVLAVVGGIIAIAVPNLYRALPGVELRAGADELTAGLRQARAQAISGNRPVAFEIDGQAGRYGTGAGGPDGRLQPGLGISLVTARAQVSGPARGAILFFPDGTSTGGRIELAKGGRQAVIEVDWLTGRVSAAD